MVLYLSSGSINASAEVTVIETGEVQPWEIHMSWEGLCSTGYAQIYDDFEDFEVCIDPEDFPGDEDELFIVVRENRRRLVPQLRGDGTRLCEAVPRRLPEQRRPCRSQRPNLHDAQLVRRGAGRGRAP